MAIAACIDDGTELLFSERYACPHCGYSLTELEPRIFSFNNPKGACSSCDGLGVREYFDPELVVHNPDISLAGGAIRGWDRRNAYWDLTPGANGGDGNADPAHPGRLGPGACRLPAGLFLPLFLPDGTPEQMHAFNELQRVTSSPEIAARIVSGFQEIDVRAQARRITQPTLVLHARDDLRIPFEEGRLAAATIPNASLVTLESRNHILLEDEPAWGRFLEEVHAFLRENGG